MSAERGKFSAKFRNRWAEFLCPTGFASPIREKDNKRADATSMGYLSESARTIYRLDWSWCWLDAYIQ